MIITLHSETDTARTDNTLAEDGNFTFEIPANFTGNIYFYGVIASTGGIKWLFELPDGATSGGTMVAKKQNNPNPIHFAGRKVALTDGGNFTHAWPVTILSLIGWITTGENGGTCRFLWAQNTTNATATVLDSGATLTIVGDVV